MNINKNYKDFFYQGRRATSKEGKSVVVIKEEKIKNFFETLVNDNSIPDLNKLLIGICLSGGLRISEALAIKKKDIEIDGDNIYITVTVLKKKLNYDLKRDIYVYPLLNTLINRFYLKTKPQEFIFKEREGRKVKKVITRQTALHAIKKYLGKDFDMHALRHSNVSLLMNESFTDVEISKVLELSTKMVSNYAHVSARKKMRDLLQRKAA
jgi:integrase